MKRGWLVLLFLIACQRTAAPPPAPPDLAPAGSLLPPSPVVEMVSGWYSFAARLEDGRVFTWGHFLDAPEQAQPRPVLLPLPGKPTAMAGAFGHAYFCFALDDGAVCRSRLPRLYGVGWGDFWAAEAPAPEPRAQVRQIAADERHVCGVTSDEKVRCWGAGMHGELGECAPIQLWQPYEVGGVDHAVQVVVGSAHACARRDDGTVWCWGGDDDGQLGDADYHGRGGKHREYIGDGRSCERPRAVAGLSHVVELAAGTFFNCARRDDGSVWCWGSDVEGELGDGSHDQRSKPMPVADLNDAVELRAAGESVCARRKSGHVICWGHDQRSDYSGRMYARTPKEILGLDDARTIAVGTYGGCAVRASGQVACWGSRRFGQLGDGETAGSAALTVVRW